MDREFILPERGFAKAVKTGGGEARIIAGMVLRVRDPSPIAAPAPRPARVDEASGITAPAFIFLRKDGRPRWLWRKFKIQAGPTLCRVTRRKSHQAR